MDITAKEIQNEPVDVYAPDGNLIVTTNNELVFTDIRVQIKEQSAKGYYIVFKGQKIPLDQNGRPKEWPDGLFDKFNYLLMELI